VSAEALTEALYSMRDVPGVEGSFVVSEYGRLLARDMPAIFGDDVLSEVGPRALRLRDTLAYEADTLEGCVLRYPDYLLFCRPMPDGLLVTLTRHGVNLPAVRMAMSLASRRVRVLLEQTAAAAAAAGPRAAGAGAGTGGLAAGGWGKVSG
jgi:predicted regulator of Ras-like GTPase activity (Roadblock/LC7/MglB family)